MIQLSLPIVKCETEKFRSDSDDRNVMVYTNLTDFGTQQQILVRCTAGSHIRVTTDVSVKSRDIIGTAIHQEG